MKSYESQGSLKRLEDKIRDSYQDMIADGLHKWLLPLSSHCKRYQIGHCTFSVDFQAQNLVAFFHPAIAHRLISKDVGSSYTVQIQMGASDSNLSWLIRDIRQGSEKSRIELSSDPQVEFHYNEWNKEAVIVDHARQSAIWWIESEEHLRSWQRSFSLRKIFNLCLQPTSLQLIHAAGVSVSGKGIVLTGKGGTGKSTLALSALLEGCQFIGDDFILVDTQRPKNMYSMYQIGKLEQSSLNLLPDFKVATTSYTDHDKIHIDLTPWRDLICLQTKVDCIVLPVIAQVSQPLLEPCRKQEIVAATALSTLHLLSGSRKSMMWKINNYIEGLPCFKFIMHSEPRQNVLWLQENITKYV